MQQLPAPLDRLDLGEILGFLRTAGQVPVAGDDGREQLVSLWLVVCRDRCWLVGASREGAWTTASTDVRLDRGWTWDAVRVGSWGAPLRPGTRGQADGLLAKWRLAEKSGDPVDPPMPAHGPERARIAAGADVPPWIAERVPADPDARWLFAMDTREVRHFPGADGQPERAPLWLAATDRHVTLVAAGPWVLEVPIDTPAALTAAWPGAGEAVAWVRARGPDAWDLALRHALDARAWDAAARLASEAWVLGRHTASWSRIGLLALGSGSTEAAVGAVLRQLEGSPADDVLAVGANDWSTRIRRLERAAPRLPDGPLSDCPVPPRPDGFPWPPDGPTEVHAFAGLLAGPPWVEPALALLAQHAEPARVAVARAAERSGRGAPDAGQAWWDAAVALHPADPAAARAAADRAIARIPEGPSEGPSRADVRYRASVWAVEANADPGPLWDAALPAVPPSDLGLPPEAWRRLATRAQDAGARDAAAAAWRAVHTALPDERQALVEEARQLEALGRLEHALGALETLPARTDRALEPDPPAWWVHGEIARVATALGRTDRADEALRQAVAGEFLQRDALQRALELGEGVVDADRLAWWRHLGATLSGGDAPGRAPAPSLDRPVLDGLHPGGEGWLGRVQRSLDVREPPPIRDLTRGLERIDGDRWAAISQPLGELSDALGMPVPAAYLFRGDGAFGLSAWPTAPPLVLVGHEHVDPDGRLALSPPALRFALAVELVHLAAGHPLLGYESGIVGTSRSVYAAFGRYAGTAETVVDLVTLVPGVDQLAKIQTVIKLSKRVFTARSAVDKVGTLAESGRSWIGWTTEGSEAVGRRFEGAAIQFRLQADRAALLLTGDLRAAVDAILRTSPTTAEHADRARQDGVIAVLDQVDEDTRMRLAGLLAFAASL